MPSPALISAIMPRCKTMPPMSWTSKWRSPSVRLLASLTAAKASTSRPSRPSPRSWRSRSPAVIARRSSSGIASKRGSSPPILATIPSSSRLSCLSMRTPPRPSRAALVWPRLSDSHIVAERVLDPDFRSKFQIKGVWACGHVLSSMIILPAVSYPLPPSPGSPSPCPWSGP